MPDFLHLVVDTNAIISGATLPGLAVNYWTTEEVLAEIRDVRARAVLETLPFTLNTRQPAESSIAAVTVFARATGDLPRLSRADLLVLALTHQLEKEANGLTFIRTEPPKAPTKLDKPGNAGGRAARAPPAPGAADVPGGRPCRFFRSTTGCRNGESCAFSHATNTATSALPAASDPSRLRDTTSVGAAATASTDAVDSDDGAGLWVCPAPQGSAISGPVAAVAGVSFPFGYEIVHGSSFAPEAAHVDADATTPSRKRVGCITSDFPMQNVLLQMNLCLASVGGKVVRSVKSWVLKCDACFTITEMGRLFCPRCGNATLARLGVTLGEDGAPRYHYKSERTFNNRGTIYSIPAPKGGRPKPSQRRGAARSGATAGGSPADVLLREDQLLMGAWAVKMRTAGGCVGGAGGAFAERMATSLGGEMTAPVAHAPSAGGIVASAAAGAAAAGIVVGFGHHNPNASRRGGR